MGHLLSPACPNHPGHIDPDFHFRIGWLSQRVASWMSSKKHCYVHLARGPGPWGFDLVQLFGQVLFGGGSVGVVPEGSGPDGPG